MLNFRITFRLLLILNSHSILQKTFGFIVKITNFGEVWVTPETGLGLLFDHYLLHEGAAVTSGRKYVLRSDVIYGPVGQLLG
jgi:hypothetical protein